MPFERASSVEGRVSGLQTSLTGAMAIHEMLFKIMSLTLQLVPGLVSLRLSL